MPAANSALPFFRRFLLKSGAVLLVGLFAGVVAVIWTQPGSNTPPPNGRESEVRVRAAFDPKVTMDVPADPPAERTSRATPHARPPGAEPPEYTPIPATNLPTEPVIEPPVAAARAVVVREPERAAEADGWKRDPRFARLTVDVRSGTATIGGRARAHAAAWELAEEVRTWPAVERVVVGKVDLGR